MFFPQFQGYEGCYTPNGYRSVLYAMVRWQIQGISQLASRRVPKHALIVHTLGSPTVPTVSVDQKLGNRSLVGVCDLECQGDDLQQCGGEEATSVYSGMLPLHTKKNLFVLCFVFVFVQGFQPFADTKIQRSNTNEIIG